MRKRSSSTTQSSSTSVPISLEQLKNTCQQSLSSPPKPLLDEELANVKKFSLDEIEIIEKIASGGFAEVFKVRIADTIYAGKKMLKSRAQLERNVDKFRNELVTMDKLYGMGCKKVLSAIGYCFDKENQIYWIITEFMDVGDLYAIIHCRDISKNVKRVHEEFPNIVDQIHNDTQSKIKLALELAMCIHEIHSVTRYAHLDVKSLNVLVNSNLEIRLGDWCDAKEVDLSKSHHLTEFQPHGTIFWMAPEAMKKNLFTQKSDIFSLSIVFSELLSLSKPYPGMNVLDVKDEFEKNSDKPFRMNIYEIMNTKGLDVDELSKSFIELIEDMWKEEVTDRLSSQQVVDRLSSILNRVSEQ